MLRRSTEEICRPGSKSVGSMQPTLAKELMLSLAKGAAIAGSGLFACHRNCDDVLDDEQ